MKDVVKVFAINAAAVMGLVAGLYICAKVLEASGDVKITKTQK